MKPFFTHARSHFTIFLLLVGGAAGTKAQTPTADEILHAARLSPLSQQSHLNAQLSPEEGKPIPFTISLEKGVVNYDFTNPDQQIQLALGEDSSELRERVGGKTAAIKSARYDEKVRGTPITYEDLALRMLYWPKPKLLGEETVKLQKTWKLEIQAPRGQSQYGVARLWIDQANGALMRMEGYGMDGRIIKKFEVISAQKIDGKWMLKSMRVEAFDPATHKSAGLAYLKILGAAK
jgi:hypothetical protein